MGTVQDFDLHGIVGIRLVDAEPGDCARVARQLGPITGRLTGTPDITIRFVDRLDTGPLTYVGVGDTGFDEDGFYLLRGRGGAPAKALFPFDQVGEHLEVVCEREMPAVPHLLPAINMVALSKNVLPLHASAYEQDGRCVLVTGWAKGGKTESLLAAMQRGACYVGDEWIYITQDGEIMGLPEPIRLWAWHLAQQPDVLSSRTASERRKLSVWRNLASLAEAAGTSGAGSGLARRAQPLLQRQAYLQISPEELFGRERMSLHGRLDAAVLMLSHDCEDIIMERARPDELSGRMAASLTYEREQFMAHYRQFRFAFPSRRSTMVETAAVTEERLLRATFDGRAAGKVSHPYPCDIAALGDAVSRVVNGLAQAQPAYVVGQR